MRDFYTLGFNVDRRRKWMDKGREGKNGYRKRISLIQDA